MSEFKIGDTVVFQNPMMDWEKRFDGMVGKIIIELFEGRGYIIRFSNGYTFAVLSSWIRKPEVKKTEKNDEPRHFDDRTAKDERKPKTRRVVITITDDGAEAEYIVGRDAVKGAFLKRYFKDEPNDGRAALHAVLRLFGFSRIAKEDGKFFTEDEIKKMKTSAGAAMGDIYDILSTLKSKTEKTAEGK